MDSNEGDARSGGDLLLSLARGEARAEALSDRERAEIGVETSVTRALRWATAVDGLQHFALVGPAGTGKSFAVRMADRLGLAGFDLPAPEAATAAEVVQRVVSALRENRRLLLTARPEHLSVWVARDDMDEALIGLLRQTQEALGVRDVWPPGNSRTIEVFDLSHAVVTQADVLNELLRHAASLALRDPRDAARHAASSALRDRSVCAWAKACALDAEDRTGPLTIAELWRFVATLACGGRPARVRARFDLADSVAARLMRHEFTSGRMREAASHPTALRLDALALSAGFEGSPEDVYCSDPGSLAALTAVSACEPPKPQVPPGGFLGKIKNRPAGACLRADEIIPGPLASALSRLAERTTKGGRLREGVAERSEPYAVSLDVSVATPNPFMCRAFGDAWRPALCVRGGDRTTVLTARAFDALCGFAAQGRAEALVAHPAIAMWCGTVRDGGRGASAPVANAAPDVGDPGEDRDVPERPDEQELQDSAVVRDLTPTWRPWGLLVALNARGMLEVATHAGGAFRVSSPTDLASTAATLAAVPEHVERWQASDRLVLGAPLREFLDARAALIEACPPLVAWEGGAGAGKALGAWAAPNDGPPRDAQIKVFAERYVASYATLMEAAAAAGGDTLERALMLDLAYCVDGTHRRARMMPQHPLMVSRWLPSERGDPPVLPPVIAVRHRRTFALYAEGEPGFYHGDPERWPPIEAQRNALREAVDAWLRRSGSVASLELDLIDARFPEPLLEEAASRVANLARERGLQGVYVRVRSLASSLHRSALIAAPSEVAPRGAEGVSVVCDPSVRSIAEARTGSFAFAVVPAPHGGRLPFVGHARAAGAYLRALAEARIDARPHRLERSPEPTFDCAASFFWWAPTPEDESGSGEWRLKLRGDIEPAPTPPDASPVSVTIPSKPVTLVTTAPTEPSTLGAPVEPLPRTAPPQQARPEDDGGDPPTGDNASAPPSARRWSREALRAQVAQVFGRGTYPSDESLVADLVRDTVSARRAPLRHAVIRDVARCVAPLLEGGEARDVVTRTVDALVDLGDLVARRSSERGPYLIELASAALVDLRGSGRALLLGRAEVALSDDVRRLVTTAGPLRTIDLAQAQDAREELRFHGATELSWEEWARTPRYVSPEETLSAQGGLTRFDGSLAEYDTFDPTTSPRFYLGRFRRGALESVLERDRWAVGARDGGLDAREYRLFRRTDGTVTSVVVEHARFVELAAACAARVADGRPFLASEAEGVVRLHFPPPRWLTRVLALGSSVDPGGALIAWQVPRELRAEVRAALQRGLWCEVVSG